MMKLLTRAAVAAALPLLIATGPASALDTLKVASAQKGFWDTSFVELGQEKGFFKDQGIQLDIIWTDGGADAQQALITGSFDVSVATGILGVVTAYAKGAPIVLLSSEMTGASDLYWYVRADSPIKSLKDLQGKTFAYSRPGSSSNLIAAALVKKSGTDAKLVSAGGPPATLTQVMSGQLDVGWSAVPGSLDLVKDGKIRVIARGNDAPGAADQTVRVNATNATVFKERRDVLRRFLVAYQKTIDWIYGSPEVLQVYGKFANVKPEVVDDLRTHYILKKDVDLTKIGALDETIKEAVDTKKLSQPLTAEQKKAFLQPMQEMTKGLK
jgi:NitT/TauT family transport system substrate-binding protein